MKRFTLTRTARGTTEIAGKYGSRSAAQRQINRHAASVEKVFHGSAWVQPREVSYLIIEDRPEEMSSRDMLQAARDAARPFLTGRTIPRLDPK